MRLSHKTTETGRMKNALRRQAFWARDFFINHGAVRKHLADIKEKLDGTGVQKLLLPGGEPAALKAILDYAVRNTVFYQGIGVGAPLTAFPVMNKTVLNENRAGILSPEFAGRKTHAMHTSGSTGIPFTVIQNPDKRFRHIADLKYFGALAGYLDHDPMCYLRAKPTATLKEQRRQNIWQMDICSLSEENLTRYYHDMVKKGCVALMAYPSTLLTAVSLWEKRFRNESSVRTIISTSEAMTDEIRRKLKDFFGENCGIFARYSNTENGILGQENGEEGVFILNWASYFFELLQLDRDEPAAEGELGRIVITDYYNKAFPMIRYDTGDVARMVRPQNGFPYLTDLFGRRMDLIYDTKHEVVSPFLLCRTMRLSKGVEQWQFIQDGDKTYRLRITVTKDKKPDCEAELQSFLRVLGSDAQITLEYVEDIPVMSSLKRKLIVSNIGNA